MIVSNRSSPVHRPLFPPQSQNPIELFISFHSILFHSAQKYLGFSGLSSLLVRVLLLLQVEPDLETSILCLSK